MKLEDSQVIYTHSDVPVLLDLTMVMSQIRTFFSFMFCMLMIGIQFKNNKTKIRKEK